ncbi:hypothetical protein [Amycolatopsis sp.]|jgi:phytoene dehydrogenase-like protein|uniref:hypothetical protein n=1 Tax=Amycolatopsis sp. TaxID=37632 RepID=UPI00263530A8|nr:hypothetical protein [Amycolatopsis sp.]
MATNETVAAAWLATMTALPIGDTLTSSTVPDGFVRHFTVATTLDPSMAPVGSRTMRVQIDVFYSGPTEVPPWGKADGAGEAIARSVPRMANNIIPGFPAALINEAWISDGPVRVHGDTAALAHVTLDAQLIWTPTI